MKTKRQKIICDLIRKFDIETQEELASLLGKNGYTVTQTTVSRDIKDLKLVKIPTGSGTQYKYTLPELGALQSKRYTEIFERQLTNIAISDAMVILKTSAGAAMLVAQAVDALNDPVILGTVSGYNTVFVAVDSPSNAKELYDELKHFIKSSK